MPITMTAGVAELPDHADAVPDRSSPVLSDQIQRHLGSLLAVVYAREKVEPSATDRFAELLTKLDAALGEIGNRDDAEFKGMLVAGVPVLRRFAIALTRNSAAADDLVQDTLLRAWRSRARFERGTNFEAWTFTILRNTFYTDRRKSREVQDEDGTRTARLATPPEQAGRLDLKDVRSAIDRLPPAMREALILVVIENLTHDEAAVVMNCRIGTVKSRVWRAREQLVRVLGYTGSEFGSDGVMLSALAGRSEVAE
jgi:RNA polymerase sigma-70 factor (ECF subfamily)